MKEKVSEEKKAAKREYWGGRIAEQERSGLSVQQFCKEQGLTEQAFYFWRKRLRNQEPMRFALVGTGTQQQPGRGTSLELVLPTGEWLRIGAGVDRTLLRTVLEALRA